MICKKTVYASGNTKCCRQACWARNEQKTKGEPGEMKFRIRGQILMTALACVVLAGGVASAATIPVATWAELEAATPAAGDVIQFGPTTYNVTGQVQLVSDVTYLGDPGGGTIIDGGGTTRAFTAWLPGRDQEPQTGTAPTGWVLDNLTIQNCSSDAINRAVDNLSWNRGLRAPFRIAPS